MSYFMFLVTCTAAVTMQHPYSHYRCNCLSYTAVSTVGDQACPRCAYLEESVPTSTPAPSMSVFRGRLKAFPFQ